MDTTQLGVVTIEVVEGRSLVAMDSNGTSDPYVCCVVGSKKKKTKIIRDTLNPKWTVGDPELFKFKVRKNVNKIVLECYDWDRFNADDRMGMVNIPISELLDEEEHDGWFKLVPMKAGDPVDGDLHIKLKFTSQITEKHQKNPLVLAIKSGDLQKVVSLLASNDCDPNLVDVQRNTPLHLAAVGTHHRILLAMLNNRKVSISAEDINGNTPLHVFAHKNTSPNVEELIALFLERKASINATNAKAETPLHKACLNTSVKVMMAQTLISRGANVNAVNSEGDRPIDYAIKLGREDLVYLLVRNGATPTFEPQIELAKTLNFLRISEKLRGLSDVYLWFQKIGFEAQGLEAVKNDITKDLLPQLKGSDLDGLGFKTTKDKETFFSEARAIQKPQKRQSLKLSEKRDKLKDSDDLHQKVRSLKYLNLDSGSWVVDFESLEFANSLGKGSSGQVFMGFCRGEKVAIKVLPATDTNQQAEEFAKEFQIICYTNSPNIVKFYGACIKPRLCILMEFCEQGSLFDVLSKPDTVIGWDKVFSFATGTVKAIHDLHNCTPHIMHRDLKSLNVLITHDNIAKVCDFGLSRFDTSSNLKTLAKLRGTYHYVAPELYALEKFTFKSDVYSVGIILWELVNRCITQKYSYPFSEYPHLSMDFQVLIAAARNHVRPSIPASTPDSFKTLILRCYSRNPDERPTTQELLDSLQSMQTDFEENPVPWNAAIVQK